MKSLIRSMAIALAALASVMLARVYAQDASSAVCTMEVDITKTIGPATVDLLNRVQDHAVEKKCSSILLLVNTPGGSLESTRIIVEKILNSPIPYLCLVSPSGGHAGSAGAIILQACHVNGALAGTNLGAATPVAMGQDLPKDLRQKIMNDTRSWLESLTKLRGRNEKFGRDIILEAKAVTAEEAHKLKAIDTVSSSKEEFLKFAEGREVEMAAGVVEKVRTATIHRFEQDLRHSTLTLLTDPELAYMLLLAALALLYFEITHPGTMVAGVIGGIALIIALVALHKLDVEWGGLALILLGIGLLIAEMFLPTFGMLGVGGVVSFVLGSLFLFDPVKSFGYTLPWTLIAPVVIFFAMIFIGVSMLMLKTRRVKKRMGYDELLGRSAKIVKTEDALEGWIEIAGELWRVRASHPISAGDRVKVQGYQGLVLQVEKEV